MIRVISIITLAGLWCCSSAVAAPNQMFLRTMNGIVRCDLDGNNMQTIIDFTASGGGDSGSLAVDTIGQKIYWSETGRASIWRANLDGTNAEKIIDATNSMPHTLTGPRGIDIDPLGHKIYIADSAGGQLLRANLDGSDVELIPAGTEILCYDVLLGSSIQGAPAVGEIGLVAMLCVGITTGAFLFARRRSAEAA